MRKSFLIAAAALVAVAIPSGVALAEKFRTSITAQTNDDQDAIFGVVRSKEIACEKARDVRLYGPEFNGGKRGNGFRRYGEDKTNRFGEYRFNEFEFQFFPSGDYFTRAIRKDFPGDVCRKASSPVITLFSD